jgi:Ni/Co efflux regulator RcnB
MSHTRISSLLLAAALLGLCSTAYADRDKSEHNGRSNARHEERDRQEVRHEERRDAGETRISIHIGDHERVIVRDYYTTHRCPPGLAKKHNGCMPPGQIKRWAVGQPLPRDVVFHDLPHGLSIELGVPPSGHRYIRVAADILLIAVGTGMVVDAIEDLGRMQ